MNGTFYEQLGGVAGVFEQWGACEQTVVACTLARRVPWPGLKLVQRAVEAALRSHVEDERLEREANDEALLAGLLAVRDDDDEDGGERLRRLLNLLPLLRMDNERGKDIYVTAAPALVQRCVDAPRRSSVAPDLCRQLLSYLLVHPALTHHDQRTLTEWLRYLENHISGNRNPESVWQQRIETCLVPDNNIWSSNNTFRRTIGKNVEFRGILDTIDYAPDLLQESFSKNGRDVDISIEGEKPNFEPAISQPKSQRSNSLTPPSTNFMHMSSSAENLSDEPFVQKPRSFSLSSEHSLSQIRPISIMYGTTGSETRLDDLRSHNFGEHHPGMSTVAQWLKGLRLHKYVWLFTNMSYEQMMTMDEKYLEKLGVTKGARHKLLLSIKKLSERGAVLEAVEAELRGGAGGAGRALERLRGVLLSPMPPASDLPAAIVRALHLASKCLNTASCSGRVSVPDEEHEPPVDPLSLHCWLVEKALHHDAFSRPDLLEALRGLRHRLPPRQFFHHVSDMPLNRRCPKPRWRINPHNGYHKPMQKRMWSSGGGGTGGACTGPLLPRGKSHSYPPHGPRPPPPPSGVGAPPRPPPGGDDYSSLDALCLQMTEQAIN
ncbi:sterile alpha motif domain containing protein 4 smaug [Anticarsia gemmatalis]|uniref:sterile alpha motif domain containing protein 4 smaug n=1 Tax=Anticarsia gemmatalis TaxID=129554 RepID=UPI003F775E7F